MIDPGLSTDNDDPFFFSHSININIAKTTHTIRLPRKPAPTSIYVGNDTYISIALYKNGTIFVRLHIVRRKVTVRLDV